MTTATVLCPTEKIKVLHHSPVAAKAVDEIVVINGNVCIAYADVGAGAEGMFIYAAEEIEAVKATGVTITEGDPIFWDPSASKFTNVDGAGANNLCGIARKGAGSSATTVNFELNNALTAPWVAAS